MNNFIKVSTIVPVYNGEKTISRCLNSVRKQTVDAIEIIVVDDGSIDNTRKIIEQLMGIDKRIRYVFQINSGQGAARNKGLSLARGEYVSFIDADDEISSNMYFQMIMLAKKYMADMVQCNYKVMNASGHLVLDKGVRFGGEFFNLELNRRKYYQENVLTRKHSYEVWNKLIKRSTITDKNLTFCKNAEVHTEDMLFSMDLAMVIKSAAFTDESLYIYYEINNSHSRTVPLSKLRQIVRFYEVAFQHAIQYKVYNEIENSLHAMRAINILNTASQVYDFNKVTARLEVEKIINDKEILKSLQVLSEKKLFGKKRFIYTPILSFPNWAKFLLVRSIIHIQRVYITLKIIKHKFTGK